VPVFTLSRVVALKVAAATAATVVAGGAAFAATGARVPGPGSSASSPAAQAGAPSTRTSASHSSSAKAGGDHGDRDRGSRLFGLCIAWEAHNAPHPAAKPGEPKQPPFQELIAEAGGKDKVAAFCAALVAKECAGRHDGKPVPQGRGDEKGRPTELRCPKPAAGRPSVAPTGSPSGAPSGVPGIGKGVATTPSTKGAPDKGNAPVGRVPSGKAPTQVPPAHG
jgi:hypothetical protein